MLPSVNGAIVTIAGKNNSLIQCGIYFLFNKCIEVKLKRNMKVYFKTRTGTNVAMIQEGSGVQQPFCV